MFSGIRLYAALGVGIAFALLLAWGVRVDHLRGVYHGRLDAVSLALKNAGLGKPKAGEEANGVKLLASYFARATAERDTARALVDVQSQSIDTLHAETERYAREAEANRKMIAAAVKERNAWISRAKAAETRTERLSAEQEVAECESVLNDLYASGF
jgi:hypothetical protein